MEEQSTAILCLICLECDQGSSKVHTILSQMEVCFILLTLPSLPPRGLAVTRDPGLIFSNAILQIMSEAVEELVKESGVGLSAGTEAADFFLSLLSP